MLKLKRKILKTTLPTYLRSIKRPKLTDRRFLKGITTPASPGFQACTRRDQLLGELFHDYLVLLATAHDSEVIRKVMQLFVDLDLFIPPTPVDEETVVDGRNSGG